MKLEKYLTEKTYRINADVDYIYNKVIKPTHKLYLDKKYDKFNQALRGSAILGHVKSSELKSKECQMAHALNPIDIIMMFDSQGNYYRPDASAIHFTYNSQAIEILQATYYNEDAIKKLVGSHTFKRFMNEMSVSSLKGSIYHEVSHWLNDSLHNKILTKTLDRAAEDEGHASEIMNQGHENVNFTFFEIDAQIHSIKQMKRDLKGAWKDVDWEDIINYKPAFWGVFRRAANSNEYDEYIKNLVKRMNREKLLNKKLQKVPNKRDMMIIVTRT